MDTDESEMSSIPIDTVKDDTASNVCKVCGINTVFMYLGVKCCAPCKMFFRRNANFDLVRQSFLFCQRVFSAVCVEYPSMYVRWKL